MHSLLSLHRFLLFHVGFFSALSAFTLKKFLFALIHNFICSFRTKKKFWITIKIIALATTCAALICGVKFLGESKSK